MAVKSTWTKIFKNEIKAVRKSSRVIAKICDEQIKAVEENPSSFEPPLEIPPGHGASGLAAQGVVIRKAYLRHRSHDYRIVFLHKTSGGQDKVVFLYARKRGVVYDTVDWAEILELAADL